MARAADPTRKGEFNKSFLPHAPREGSPRTRTLFNCWPDAPHGEWLQLTVFGCAVLLPLGIYTLWLLSSPGTKSIPDSPSGSSFHLETAPIFVQLRIFILVFSMVLPKWFGLAARASSLWSSQAGQAADRPTYTKNAVTAIGTLQTWYNQTDGLWDTTGWWNSANCLTVLADFATQADNAQSLDIPSVIANTFDNAQKLVVTAQKSMLSSGLVQSRYVVVNQVDAHSLVAEGFPSFLNDYYDDEGWWALALVRSWDLVQEPAYLDMAQNIFEDMKKGTDDVCGGGIWWSKDRGYKNAIANELYLSLAASLANRVPDKKDYYLDIAEKEWDWFRNSGMINENNNINDGLTINPDGSCVNNNLTAWSYNQGVVLGGLVELHKATSGALSSSRYGDEATRDYSSSSDGHRGRSPYLHEANTIAKAGIKLLSDSDGVIHDVGCEPNCGSDGNQFKGIFMRNLGYLHDAAPQAAYKESILANADSIWAKDRNTENNQLGVVWSGPFDVGGGPTAATHSSATDALVAAIVAAGW